MRQPDRLRSFLCALLLILLCSAALAQDGFKQIQDKVVERALKNGLKLLILPRHEAPVVSFHTYVDVGSVNEHKGITGLAHIFEHMAFKGTTTIGTKDYQKEKAALDKVDAVYMKLKEEQAKGEKADKTTLEKLQKEFEAAQEAAGQYVVNNEFSQTLEQAGAVGINAQTAADSTEYFFSLPSNKVELWMLLESERFLEPVLREFYKEREVVKEERRRSVESQPIGKLIEEFLSVAYKAHPYGEPTIGHMSDLNAITRADAEKFFATYYVPVNMTISVVGDVDPQEVIRLAEKYFGRIPSKPKPRPVETVEPPQLGERRFTIEEQSQPVFVIGYHKPSVNHKDEAVFDAITDVLGSGRTSRLYRSLVRDKKLATVAGAFPGLPGRKYPNLFIFFAFAAPGHNNQELEKAIDEEIEKIKTELVDQATLDRVKARAKAHFIRQLNSNSGMATELVAYQALTGDWRNLFRELDKINAVTADDIKRVANEYFQKKNRTVGMIEPMAKTP